MAVLLLLVQLLENNIIVPRIQGTYLRIHPAFIIMLLVSGSYVFGLWGLVLAVPLGATVWEVYKYVRSSLHFDETR